MNVICLGDSNTYGFDPRSYFGSRYSADCRWVDILGVKTGWNVINEGMNGREIPGRGMTVPEGTDLMIVMLGTNDLLQGRSPEEAASRMAAFLERLSLARDRILLLAPPPMDMGELVSDEKLVEASRRLAVCYRALSEAMGVRFADAGEWGVSLTFDGVHFTEDGHRTFAEGLLRELARFFPNHPA